MVRLSRRRAAIVAAVIAGGVAAAPANAQTADTTAPTITAATLDPAKPTGMRSPWYRGPVTVKLSATDDTAVTKLQYSTDNGATWQDAAITVGPSVSGTVAISQQGNTVVRFRALDAAGNSTERTSAVSTTLSATIRPGATAMRVASTAGLAAGDRLTLDTGASAETVQIASVVTPDPASPAANVVLTAPIVTQHSTNAPVVAQNAINAAIDSIPPVLDPGLVAGPITSTSVLAPLPYAFNATVPAGGGSLKDSGSSSGTGLNRPGIVEMQLDGKRINPAAVNLYDLAAGAHTYRAWVNDAAGNSVWYTIGFTKTIGADGTHSISAITTATEPAPTPTQRPFVSPTKMTPNPDAAYKVLVFSRTQGFRHNHIEDTIVAVQKMGAENGFNVDVYDPALPAATLAANPLLDPAALAGYKAVIFDSTTGNDNFNDTEYANLKAYMAAGGGFVGIHAATDCCRGTTEPRQWYQSMVGGIFTGHPQGPFSLAPGCETCFWATAVTEDPIHPATAHLPARWQLTDELYNLDRNARKDTHVLQSLDESSYAGNLNLQTVGGTMGDHPISWCQNVGGGRAFTQVLGHLRELWYDANYLRNVLAGIQTAAGVLPANCISFREAREAAAGLGTQASTLLDSAYAAYAPPRKDYAAAVGDIDGLRTLAQQAGNTAAVAKADALRAWMLSLGADRETGTVGGTVPATLSLTLGAPASFGAFTPALTKEYETSSTATVTSTAGDATLSVSNPGYLANGAYTLAEPLRVGFSKSVWTGPVSNDNVTIAFKQLIKATDPLRTGSYSKSVTFTLSTTTP